MSEIIQNLGSLAWWFSVVVVGVLVNLISSYWKPKLDSTLDRFSAVLKSKHELNKKQWAEEMESLADDADLRGLYNIKMLDHLGSAQYYLIFSLLMITLLIGSNEFNRPITTVLSEANSYEAFTFIMKAFLACIAMLASSACFGRSAVYQKKLVSATNILLRRKQVV